VVSEEDDEDVTPSAAEDINFAFDGPGFGSFATPEVTHHHPPSSIPASSESDAFFTTSTAAESSDFFTTSPVVTSNAAAGVTGATADTDDFFANDDSTSAFPESIPPPAVAVSSSFISPSSPFGFDDDNELAQSKGKQTIGDSSSSTSSSGFGISSNKTSGALASPVVTPSKPFQFKETGVQSANTGSTSPSSFESFGFEPVLPQRAPPPEPPKLAVALDASSSAVSQTSNRPNISTETSAPLTAAFTSGDLTKRSPLEKPSPPRLALAEIAALHVEWDAVSGATAYFIDYEPRSVVGDEDSRISSASVWIGTQGARATESGTSLLRSTRVKLNGLMKNSYYAVRVTAVRALPVSLPGSGSVQQFVLEESTPSEPSSLFRTLNPGLEVARLQATNAKLSAENERIPGLENRVLSLENELAARVKDLADARAEIVRLVDSVNSTQKELHAQRVANNAQSNLLMERDHTIASDTAEILRLNSIIADLENELANANDEISRQSTALHAAGEDLDAVKAERDARTAELTSTKRDLEATKRRLESTTKALEVEHAKLGEEHEDKGVIVHKLAADASKMVDEIVRLQNELTAAQDHIEKTLQPVADIVYSIRARQEAWDREIDRIEHTKSDGLAVLTSPFAKAQAKQKLGPRPTLTI